jgi:pimeloyl-ACP methyl ester carboxylesterase
VVTTNERGTPPRRSEHTWTGPAGTWSYDRWGIGGRPVLLLHSPLFDRTMWWPAAAELAGECTLVAVDLPGHGHTPARRTYDPWLMVDELGQLVHDLGLRRAPLVVGHSTSGLLASMFAARFTVQAAVTVGQPLDIRPLIADLTSARVRAGSTTDLRWFLAGMGLENVPSVYRALADPRQDAALLGAHLEWLRDGQPDDIQGAVNTMLRQIEAPHLSVFGQLPWHGYDTWLRDLSPTARCVSYDRQDELAHLSDAPRFADDVRLLL